MNGKVLLDTNAVIALLGGDTVAIGKIAEANQVFLSYVVIGELFYGAYRSQQSNSNIQRIKELADNCVSLPCDSQTAHTYGRIKNILRTNGTPIPENDIWIAALAIQHNLTLITRDAHFSCISDLLPEGW